MTALTTSNLTHLWTDLLVEELVRCGVDTFAVAPGSRSTPLTMAVARHPRARAVVHFDERGTAFFALGYGRATGRPAAWITTSGTAVANGLPAAVEAASDSIPLLLLTADRPPELRDTAANQTIDQVELFGEYARWFVDLPAPTLDVPARYLLTTVDQAVYRTRCDPAGPVHLNAMFRKPLEPVDDGRDYADYLKPLDPWRERSRPFTTYAAAGRVENSDVETVIQQLRAVKRGVVVAGRLPVGVDPHPIREAARALGWPLLAEATSQMRLGGSDDDIRFFDHLLSSDGFRETRRVEAVLHLGAPGSSKRLAQHLRTSRPDPFAVVHATPARIDVHHQVTHRVEARADAFCRALSAYAGETDETSWRSSWQHADQQARSAVSTHFDAADELTEPFVAHAVTHHLPEGHGLVVASSMPVRDVNRYAGTGPAAPVAANRGASGIDGTVATAAGFVAGSSAPATLLIGDLALLHDLNSLNLLRQIDQPVVVVVLNNDGGGIFHFLPIAEHENVFEPFFGTPHGLTFEHAATMFGLRYARTEGCNAFINAYRDAGRRTTSTLIEVPTDRRVNRQIHQRLERLVANALDGRSDNH